jgi:hypothetical protein
LCEDGIELIASDQSSFSDENDLSGTDDLTVGEVIGAECSDNESDDVQFATVAQHPGPVSVLKWKDKKRSDIDFNLPRTGNKNEANEM